MSEHGTPKNYRRGCRCLPCRAAISRYETANQLRRRQTGEWRGLVDAGPTRKHLRSLKSSMQAVADVTGLHVVSLLRVKRGQRKKVWKATEEMLLALTDEAIQRERATMIADWANVPSGPTKRMLTHLYRSGFTQRELAKRIGIKGSARIDRPMIRAWNAMRIEKFYRMVTAEA